MNPLGKSCDYFWKGRGVGTWRYFADFDGRMKVLEMTGGLVEDTVTIEI